MRSSSSLPLSSCLRRRVDVSAVAQAFCVGDVAHARLLLDSDAAGLPDAYTFSTVESPALRWFPSTAPAPHPSSPNSTSAVDPVARRLSSDTPQSSPPPGQDRFVGLEVTPPSPTVASPSAARSFLASLFPSSATFAPEVSALLILLGTESSPPAVLTLPEIESLLDALPGTLLVRVAPGHTRPDQVFVLGLGHLATGQLGRQRDTVLDSVLI